MKQTAVDTHC